MKDDVKFRAAIAVTLLLVLLAVGYNAANQYGLLPDTEALLERKLYFETVISGKGLSLHEGKFWSKK